MSFKIGVYFLFAWNIWNSIQNTYSNNPIIHFLVYGRNHIIKLVILMPSFIGNEFGLSDNIFAIKST